MSDIKYKTHNITDFFDEILSKSIKDYLVCEELDIKHIYILILSILTKLNFEKVDKRFKEFGENYSRDILEMEGMLENGLQMSALSDLLITNVSFFHEKFFPNVDLQGIENEAQFRAVIGGKYFKYFTNKKFHQNIQFNFE
jgi:hypothetical protein